MLLTAMVVALAAPVAAQTIRDDFAEAFLRTFGEVEPDPMAFNDAGLSVLPFIEGTWMDTGPMMRSAELDTDLLAVVCARDQIAITLTGDDGFALDYVVDGRPAGLALTYTFSTGRYFTYTVDREGFLTSLMRGADEAGFPPGQVTAWVMSGLAGVARVEAVGPDVVMIDSPNWPPQILTRCP